MKTCLIKQPAGLGDIFFTQKIAHEIRQRDFIVVWPVIPEFVWLSEYFDCINFVDINSDFPFKEKYLKTDHDVPLIEDGSLVVPLNVADRYFPNESVMLAKYKRFGFDWSNWQNYIDFANNPEREQQLFDLIGKPVNEDSIFVNDTYGSPPDSKQCIHMQNLNLPEERVIRMSMIPNITVFEWLAVAAKCGTIHTTDSCMIYLIETLQHQPDLYMYSRFNPPDFRHVNCFLTKTWNFVQ